jgi:hypothetical protein
VTGTPGQKRRSRWLYARVLAIQAATLLGLWLLQRTFGF